MTKERTFSITIDNRQVDVRSSQTVLEAARDNGIIIPSLCAMEHLSSYGACRLCVVEVDGLRGFPTSCTTPVESGMVIRTDTAELKSLRQEILRLTLGEHPASCLFCDEAEECKKYQGTIRKVGMTTGCRYCPNDDRCELQQLTERVGLTETSYPVYYRNFRVEKYDPFYDRDYNLCILCGRCVRVCNDVRLNGTLAFKQRGKLTTIGPAFDRTHLEAGCEFCGACVNVCPTGALSAKVPKWSGKPDTEVATTCVYCPLGCQLRLQIKNNHVVDALPDYTSSFDHGLVCVKGRFAMPEYLHSPARLASPKEMTPMGYNDISWDEALSKAAEKLGAAGPDEVLLMVSPQLSNEDLFVAQQFARQVLGSEAIASSMMLELGEDTLPFIDLVARSEPSSVVDQAQTILAVDFDPTYGYSPIGIAAKKAARKGAFLATVGAKASSLDMYADVSVTVGDEDVADLLARIADEALTAVPNGKGTNGDQADGPATIGRALAGSADAVVIVGPGVLASGRRGELLQTLLKMRGLLQVKMLVLHPWTNLVGMLAMGAFPHLAPGQILKKSASEEVVPLGATPIDLEKRRKVIYLIGEIPHAALPPSDFLIYQNALPGSSPRQPDLMLPASLFAESPGTIMNADRRLLFMRQAVEPFGDSKPDWWILTKIAEKMGKGKLKYTSVASVQHEIKKQVKGTTDSKKRLECAPVRYAEAANTARRRANAAGPGAAGPYPAAGNGATDAYRGIALAEVVEGMKVIAKRSRNE